MASVVAHTIDRVRRPEYTGDNRCIPCTIANAVIAVGLALLLGVAVALVAPVWAGVAIGLAVVAVSMAAIVLRGYLVPYTPQLTKRYVPERVLALFDQHEPGLEMDPEAGVDVERILLDAGVLRERADEDLEVVPSFAERWQAEIEAIEEEAGRETLADLLGAEPSDLTFDEHGEAFVAADGGVRVGRWESRAAFLADVGAARILEDYVEGWSRATATERSRLLSGLRLFIETCPDCGGPVRFGQEVVESCCRSIDVVAVTCEECDARLFEMDVPEQLA